MLRVLKRAKSAIRRHRLKGLVPLMAKNVRSVWHGTNNERSVRSSFDEAFDIETERIAEIGSLDIDSNNAQYAVRYQPSPVEITRKVLSQLTIHFNDFSFIDFGAGKGRVLLIATEFAFRRIIGVEFSSELVEVAKRNVSKFQARQSKPINIDVVVADASVHPVPTDPLVCYLYNPFGKQILSKVEKNLRASFESHPRDIYVLYVEPAHRDVFDGSQMWEPLIDDPQFAVFRSRGAK